ncbi:MAG TPA: tRNA uridine(34) 5-carboxymethylaminomethyl modification radical SAM/GNAT enzyme Elp3 [Candidatus Moranbacteria bacterium]|nr:tRNA uridine(34) 5-carboxymethylaminomethyl modification radical SAM/GNAT enzyme Elp3 [Candidatus Moranbacteria bacterium]
MKLKFHQVKVSPDSIKQFINNLSFDQPISQKEFERRKKIFFGGQAHVPKNADIRKSYNQLIKKGEVLPNSQLEKLLFSRKIRSASGVVVVTVLTKPYPCPGNCIFCPTEEKMPKSYLSNEPAAARAKMLKFNPYNQMQSRLKVLALNGHPIDKIELIILGGTFSYLNKHYQIWFVKECFRAVNDFPRQKKYSPSTLEKEKRRNEKAPQRIIGLTLETRPDFVSKKEIIRLRKLGFTRVELGVQTIFNDVLKINQRDHSVNDSIIATKLLKDSGFKISYHLMPGLLGSSVKRDLQLFQTIFNNPDFRPDQLKIYPCTVTKNTKLYQLWKKRKYLPLDNQQNTSLMRKIKTSIPPYVRISRLIRDIPGDSIVAGPNITNLRQKLQEKETKCSCIRCREVKSSFSEKEKIALHRLDYPASDGKEIFLEFSSPDKKRLFALLRLRIPSENNKNHFISALKGSAIIREVHTYGHLVELKSKKTNSPQHIGLGKKLVKEAERIVQKEFGLNKIAVISGVGVREYYRRLGYHLEDEYMVKKLTKS